MTSDRKAAIAAYKERKTVAGVFVIRCKASSEIWVGQTPNLEKIQNRTGGFYGSYGKGAKYIPSAEISWAVKYFLDAYLLKMGGKDKHA